MNYTKSEIIALPIALITVVCISLLLFFLQKNKSSNAKKIPLIIISVIMLGLEVIKQYLSIKSGYDLWNIPLHYCSMFMFWFSLASFTKGKKSNIGFTMSFIFGVLFLLMFYIDPRSIIGGSSQNLLSSFSSFHTFIYHHLIILFMLVSVLNGFYKPSYKNIGYIALCFTIYTVFAVSFAHILQVNFTNLLSSNIGFMQNLLNKYGIVIYTIVMYLFGLISLISIQSISTLLKGVIKNEFIRKDNN